MRYEHTLGVSYTCMALAMRYSANLDQAEMAGLLHDCAKRYDDATIICKCQEHGIELTEGELRAPAVIHAKLGAWMAEHKYGITDPEVLSAIACHTTGKPAMSLLDKILYVADYIEPRRDKAPNLSVQHIGAAQHQQTAEIAVEEQYDDACRQLSDQQPVDEVRDAEVAVAAFEFIDPVHGSVEIKNPPIAYFRSSFQFSVIKPVGGKLHDGFMHSVLYF